MTEPSDAAANRRSLKNTQHQQYETIDEEELQHLREEPSPSSTQQPKRRKQTRQVLDSDDSDIEPENDNDQEPAADPSLPPTNANRQPSSPRRSTRLLDEATARQQADREAAEKEEAAKKVREQYLSILEKIKQNPRVPQDWEDANELLLWCKCRRPETSIIVDDCLDEFGNHRKGCDGIHRQQGYIRAGQNHHPGPCAHPMLGSGRVAPVGTKWLCRAELWPGSASTDRDQRSGLEGVVGDA